MPYVKRNTEGRIIAVFQTPQTDCHEYLPSEHPEMTDFMNDNNVPLESIKWQLNESDINLIRVIEDLIDVLIDRNIINITDLPPQVVEKLNLRKRIREQLHWYDELFIDVESDEQLKP